MRRGLIRSICVSVVLWPLVTWGSEAVSLERNLSLMGTYVHIAVTAPTRERAAVASERIVKELEAADAELSTWKSESPL